MQYVSFSTGDYNYVDAKTYALTEILLSTEIKLSK